MRLVFLSKVGLEKAWHAPVFTVTKYLLDRLRNLRGIFLNEVMLCVSAMGAGFPCPPTDTDDAPDQRRHQDPEDLARPHPKVHLPSAQGHHGQAPSQGQGPDGQSQAPPAGQKRKIHHLTGKRQHYECHYQRIFER